MSPRTPIDMSVHLPAALPADASPSNTGVERRRDLRVDLPFPATVRGVDATGDRFEEHAVVDSLGGSSLSLRLRGPVKRGTRLFICVTLCLGQGPEARGARVVLHGIVRRTESQPDGRCGIAVTFERHRFLCVADA